MKIILPWIASAAALSVAACNQTPAENLADQVENAADARADNMEAKADMLNYRAAEVREGGDERADAIEAAGRNVSDMSQAQRDAIVANEAAAVR